LTRISQLISGITWNHSRVYLERQGLGEWKWLESMGTARRSRLNTKVAGSLMFDGELPKFSRNSSRFASIQLSHQPLQPVRNPHNSLAEGRRQWLCQSGDFNKEETKGFRRSHSLCLLSAGITDVKHHVWLPITIFDGCNTYSLSTYCIPWKAVWIQWWARNQSSRLGRANSKMASVSVSCSRALGLNLSCILR
jgi:hypothetical protein